MIYLELFVSFFQVGLFTIGGGYAGLPLIQHQVVELHPWLTMAEFTDVITISQMTPGPIALNAATFVGMRLAGIGGAVIATLACILPSCVIVLLLAHVYYRYRSLNIINGIFSGLRPGVVGLIASAGLTMIALTFWEDALLAFNPAQLRAASITLFAAALFVLQKWKANPILVMVGTGVLGYFLYA